MRPLYLSIKGFGPYLNLELSEEDFKVLIENRLFLISGETGAGKTTIFDAILYALYGEGTIEGRTPADLISHYLKNRSGIYPEIDFKFFLDGKIYRILRRPSFQGRPENVNLWIEDILFSSKKTEVKNKIKELLGLDAKQFKKVFLIPQGEYRKILLADEKERKLLLETIFETFRFSQIEEFLKNKLKDLKNKYQSLKEREKDLQKISQVSGLKELNQKILEKEKKLKNAKVLEKELLLKRKNLEEKIKNREFLIQIYQKFEDLSKKFEELKSKEEQIKNKKELLNKLKIIKEHLNYYENLKNLWKNLKDLHIKRKVLNKSLAELSNNLILLNKKLEKLLENEKEIETKKIKLQKLKELKRQLQQKIDLEKDLKKVSIALESKIQQLKKLNEEINKIKNNLEKTQEEKDQLSKALRLIKEKDEIERFIKNFNKYENLKNQKTEVEKILANLQKEFNQLENLKKELEIKNRAESLAKFLKDGKPCPVCGSLHHPDPIKPDKNFQKKLEKIEEELLKKKNDLETVQKHFFQIKAKLDHLEEELKNLKKDELILKFKELEKELSKFKVVLEKIRIKKDPEGDLEEKIENFKNQLKLLEKQEEIERKNIEELKAKEANLKGQLEVIQSLLKDLKLDCEKISIYITTLEKEILEWENKKTKIEKNLQKIQQEKIKTETELKNSKEFLNQRLYEYKENLFKLCELKRSGVISSIKELKSYISLISKIPEFEEEIQIFYQELERTQKNLEEIKAELRKLTPTRLNYKKLSSELNELKNQKTEIENSLSKLHYQIGSLQSELDQLKEILNSLEEIKKEKKILEDETPLLEKIYNLIIGRNSKKISFHSFVLSIYIKFILKRANYYFKEFSFGRYKFVEDKVLHKKLSLEVFDHYTGSRREAKTLSGGESFLATLSLALGTSDVLLYLFRNKPFESLFIDEGFGSLDESTLEKVVNVLLNLAHQSGRIIGIISHLKDLREKFPVVLEVYKNQISGSYVKICKKF